MKASDSSLPQNIEPALGGDRRVTPFTGELQKILNKIFDDTPIVKKETDFEDDYDYYDYEDDLDELFDNYDESIEQFFNEVRHQGVTDTEAMRFINFIRNLYQADDVEERQNRFRYYLLPATLENYDLFYREETRESISAILIDLFTKSDFAFEHIRDFFNSYDNPFGRKNNVEYHLVIGHLATIYYETLLNRKKLKPNERIPYFESTY